MGNEKELQMDRNRDKKRMEDRVMPGFGTHISDRGAYDNQRQAVQEMFTGETIKFIRLVPVKTASLPFAPTRTGKADL